MLLLINTIQTDLQSTNVVEICIGLTMISKIMNADMIPAVLPLVEEKITHAREIVRKKAVLALHRFYTRSPSSISHLSEKIKAALCDSDPGVMAATLNIFYEISRTDVGMLKELTSSFVSILKQIVERRLSRDFDYHKVSAPWMQIKLLKLLSIIGADDPSSSEAMYEVIRQCLVKAESQGSAAYAVVYECLTTITKIYPSPQLVEMAAGSIGRFLKAENNNLKYLGITALVAVVQVNPAYAAEHQMIVIDCLDDPDDTLKRKTLELLCKMTNPGNVIVITDKLVEYVKSSVDPYLRKDLVPRIVHLAERFAPNNQWYLETMIALFEYAGDLVPEDTLNNLLSLIANPDSGDDAADEELRVFAFDSFMLLMEKPKLSEKLTHAMCWIIGEYAYLGKEYDQAVVMEMLVGLLYRRFEDDFETKGWVVTALCKIVSQNKLYPDFLQKEITKMKSSISVNLAQRAYELDRLFQNQALMHQVLPLDASSDDMEVDEALPFLDGFVQAALQAGAQPYMPKEDRESEPEPAPMPAQETPILRFEAYPELLPAEDTSSSMPTISEPADEAVAAAKEEGGGVSLAPAGASLQTKGPRKWGKNGYAGNKQKKDMEAQAASAGNASVATTPMANPMAEVPIAQATAPHVPEPAAFVPVVDVRQQEKDKLANSLFGGSAASFGVHSSAPKSRALRSSAAKSQAKASPQPTRANAGGSILDLPTAAPATQTQAPAQQQPADLLGGALMGLDLGAGSTQPPATSKPEVDLLGDLGDTGGGVDLLGGPSQAAQSVVQPQQSGDLLGGMLGDAPSASTNAPMVAADLLGGGDLLGTMTQTSTRLVPLRVLVHAYETRSKGATASGASPLMLVLVLALLLLLLSLLAEQDAYSRPHVVSVYSVLYFLSPACTPITFSCTALLPNCAGAGAYCSPMPTGTQLEPAEMPADLAALPHIVEDSNICGDPSITLSYVKVSTVLCCATSCAVLSSCSSHRGLSFLWGGGCGVFFCAATAI